MLVGIILYKICSGFFLLKFTAANLQVCFKYCTWMMSARDLMEGMATTTGRDHWLGVPYSNWKTVQQQQQRSLSTRSVPTQGRHQLLSTSVVVIVLVSHGSSLGHTDTGASHHTHRSCGLHIASPRACLKGCLMLLPLPLPPSTSLRSG